MARQPRLMQWGRMAVESGRVCTVRVSPASSSNGRPLRMPELSLTKAGPDDDLQGFRRPAIGPHRQHAREPPLQLNPCGLPCEEARPRRRTRRPRRASRGWGSAPKSQSRSISGIWTPHSRGTRPEHTSPSVPFSFAYRSLRPRPKLPSRLPRYLRAVSHAESDSPPQIPGAMDSENSCRLQIPCADGPESGCASEDEPGALSGLPRR